MSLITTEIVPTVEKIINITSERTGIPAQVLVDKKYRASNATEARQIAMYLTRKLTYLSYPQIAVAFNQSTHNGACYADKRVASRARVDERFQQKLVAIINAIEAH